MDWTVFHQVAAAAFANPFGERRHAIDSEIAGLPESTPREEVLDRLLRRVRGKLASAPELNVEDVPSEHRRAIELTVLFDVFHRHADAFDDLIERQQAAGAEAVAAGFGEAVARQLVLRGFGQERANRLLGVLYQVRRAFFFVSRQLPGPSDSMRRLRERVWQNVFTDDMALYESTLWSRMEDFSTFFVGETGTGKGTAAAALGRSGWIAWDPRRKRFEHSFEAAFVAINLSQFPETLIESELFGHRKGAFTGAVEAHDGVLTRCQPHGTIFLDEIGEVDEPIQIKLLRVLQERTFSPVGSHEQLEFRGRIVAATNRSIDDLRDGRMRDDLYYRLCSDVVEVPPLRVRIAEDCEELDVLVDRIVHRMIGHSDRQLCERVLEVVRTDLPDGYRWPGNVRELEQCVRRVLVTGEYAPDAARSAGLAESIAAEELSARELVARYCAKLYRRHGTYEGVARIVDLDRRTVKKHIDSLEQQELT
jgi:transcriptional regulator with AAA-type ATPase domain